MLYFLILIKGEKNCILVLRLYLWIMIFGLMILLLVLLNNDNILDII